MKAFRADLHVHTVLSPCADIEMQPPLIVSTALDRGIQILSITDHNATGNIAAVQKAADGTGLTILPGMELQTAEEVHCLCIFDTLEQAHALQTIVDRLLPPLANRPDYFGDQLYVDENGDFLGREERLLLSSVRLSISEACHHVHRLGGLFIPAHVDRKAYGLLSHLGFVPADLPVDGLEVFRLSTPDQARVKYPQIASYPLLHNGDAHRLDQIQGTNQYYLEGPSVSEIRQAIFGRNNRFFSFFPFRESVL